MTPSEIKKATLKQLREARSAMCEPEYLFEVEALPAPKKANAKAQLSDVQLAILKLRAAELKNISAGLVESERDLMSSIKTLNARLKRLKEVEAVVGATAAFLKVIGRVIALMV